MEFSCPVNRLMEALQIATKALSSRTVNPILEGILLEANMGEIQLTCSDERMSIVTRIEADVTDMGRGVVPGKLFYDMIRNMPGERVCVRMDKGCAFRMESGAAKMNLQGQEASLFPLMPRVQEEKEVSLPQDVLRDMINKTEFSIAVDDMREVLTGALLEIGGGDITMVALDGYRLAMMTRKCSEVVENVRVILPGRALGELGKLLSDDETAFCRLAFEKNKLHLSLGETTDIFLILVSGEYVKYRQILPTSFSTRVVVPLDAFRRSVGRAALIARDGNNNLIHMHFNGNVLSVDAHSQIGDVHEELDVEKTGADLSIAFNVRYMADTVRYMEDEYIVMNFNNAVSPCIVTPQSNTDYLHLILPVRTSTK